MKKIHASLVFDCLLSFILFSCAFSTNQSSSFNSSLKNDEPNSSSSPSFSSSGEEETQLETVPILLVKTTMKDNNGQWPYEKSNPIESVIDGNSDTVFVRNWCGEDTPGMIDFQLDGAFVLTSISLEWGLPGIAELSSAVTYSIFGSSDKSFYNLLAKNENAESSPFRKDLLDVSFDGSVKDLRICVYKSSGSYLSLAEVRLKGYRVNNTNEKIFASEAKASQEESCHPASNLLNGSDSTWRINPWEKGGDSGENYKDVTLSLSLSNTIEIESINLLLSPYAWDPENGEYFREVSLSYFVVEISLDGINYQKASEYKGEAKACSFGGYICQSYGISLKNLDFRLGLAKYVRFTFKKFEHLCLQQIFFIGTSLQNNLLNKGANIRLGSERVRSGIGFEAQIEKKGLSSLGELTFGIKAIFKKDLGGYSNLTKMLKAGKTKKVFDLPGIINEENNQSIYYYGFLTGIPIDNFEEQICYLPFLYNNGNLLLGLEGECSYANLSKMNKFIYPESGKYMPNLSDYSTIIGGKEYFDVYAASLVTPRLQDSSFLFPKNAWGYYISKGVFEVDEETFNRLLKSHLIGDGAIKWVGYSVENYMNNPDQFDGVLPIPKMNDPLYVMMCKPNEQHSFMDSNDDGTYNPNGRVNASNLFPTTKNYENAMTIGAVFLNPEMRNRFSLDTKITVCFGKLKLAVCTDKDGWQLVTDQIGPSDPGMMYYLPWTLDHANDNGGVMCYRLPGESIKKMSDHIEVAVTIDDFIQTERKIVFPKVKGAALHFWSGSDSSYRFQNGTKVLGLVSSYEIWVKEKEYSNLLTADIGADLYMSGDSHPDQAFTGYNFAVTNTKRVVYGHNIGPKNYNQVMDSEKVCNMLGIE